MKSILDLDDYKALEERIFKLTPDSKAKWGKMTVDQMLAHAAEVQEVKNGKPLENTPLIARLLKRKIRKMVMSEAPYEKSVHTHPQYIVSDSQDFKEQKYRLLGAMKFMNERNPQRKHPLFGTMTDEEKGWACYKHINHHLDQFGV